MCQWLHIEGDTVQNCLECGVQAAVGLVAYCGKAELAVFPFRQHEQTQALRPSKAEFYQAQIEKQCEVKNKAFMDAVQWLKAQDSEHARTIEYWLSPDC